MLLSKILHCQINKTNNKQQFQEGDIFLCAVYWKYPRAALPNKTGYCHCYQFPRELSGVMLLLKIPYTSAIGFRDIKLVLASNICPCGLVIVVLKGTMQSAGTEKSYTVSPSCAPWKVQQGPIQQESSMCATVSCRPLK